MTDLSVGAQTKYLATLRKFALFQSRYMLEFNTNKEWIRGAINCWAAFERPATATPEVKQKAIAKVNALFLLSLQLTEENQYGTMLQITISLPGLFCRAMGVEFHGKRDASGRTKPIFRLTGPSSAHGAASHVLFGLG